jgi:hypothetical protein
MYINKDFMSVSITRKTKQHIYDVFEHKQIIIIIENENNCSGRLGVFWKVSRMRGIGWDIPCQMGGE